MALAGIDLAVHTGEIVGVAGVSGNGQRELGDLLMGLMPAAAGSKLLLGRQATHWPPSRVRACGVGFIPEDALAMAAVPWFSVAENMLLGNTARYGRRRGLALARGEARQDLLASYRRLGMGCRPSTVPRGLCRAATCSGWSWPASWPGSCGC